MTTSSLPAGSGAGSSPAAPSVPQGPGFGPGEEVEIGASEGDRLLDRFAVRVSVSVEVSRKLVRLIPPSHGGWCTFACPVVRGEKRAALEKRSRLVGGMKPLCK